MPTSPMPTSYTGEVHQSEAGSVPPFSSTVPLTGHAGDWDVQLQVAQGLGKFHAAMAAARVEETSIPGRIGAGSVRKPRRPVYETDLN